MRPPFFALAALICGAHAFAEAPIDIGRHYVTRCTILGNDGTVLKTFPGKRCVFLDDGSFVAATNDPIRLARVGADGKLLWSRDLHIHHSLKLSADGKKLLTLGADVRQGDLGRVRYDDVLVLSLETGATLHRWSGYEHRKEYFGLSGEVAALVRPPAGRENLDYTYEYSHFNSISEIPDNPVARKIPAFAKGNYLVGFNGLGLFAILDPRLKRILWTMRDPMFDGDTAPNRRVFHDLQALPNGHLLVYNNELGPNGATYFALRELDPVSKRAMWQYPDHEHVHAGFSGTVQLLPDGVLFSLQTAGSSERGAAFFVDRNGKPIWSLQEPPGREPQLNDRFILSRTDVAELKPEGNRLQDIKRIDMTKFLRKSRVGP